MPILEYNPAMKEVKCCPFCGSKDLTTLPIWWKCNKCHKKFRISEDSPPTRSEYHLI